MYCTSMHTVYGTVSRPDSWSPPISVIDSLQITIVLPNSLGKESSHLDYPGSPIFRRAVTISPISPIFRRAVTISPLLFQTVTGTVHSKMRNAIVTRT